MPGQRPLLAAESDSEQTLGLRPVSRYKWPLWSLSTTDSQLRTLLIVRSESFTVQIPKLEFSGSANGDIKRETLVSNKIKFGKIFLKTFKTFSQLCHWGHPPISSSSLSSAVYSFDMTLANSSGKDIPSSSKHTAHFSTGRDSGGELGVFWPSLGYSLNREAAFPRAQQGSGM